MQTHWTKSFLNAYAAAPLEIRKKARILTVVNIIIIAALIVAGAVINLIIDLNVRTALLQLAMSLCLVGALYILHNGHYMAASNATTGTLLTGTIIAGFSGYSGRPTLDFLLLGYNLLPIMFYSCLIGRRKYQAVAATAICLAANAAYFVLFFLDGSSTYPTAAHCALFVNSSLLIAVSGVMGYHILSINREVVAIAEDEARSARMKADQIAKAEYEKELILDNTAEIIAFHDTNHTLQWANKAYLKTTGLSLPELHRKKCYQAWGLDRLCINCPVTTSIETDRPHTAELSPENQPHWPATQGSWWVSASPVKDTTGRIIGAIEVAFDMTAHRAAEAALAGEKERLLVTLRSIGDGVITTDIDGRIRLMNKVAEELTGWSMAEAVDQPLSKVFNIINENTRLPCDNPVEKVLKSSHVVGLSNQTLLVARDGVERMISDSGAPIRDAASRIIGVVLVFRDVTERYRMEQNLQNTARLEALGVLAGGIAHDFNNLLTGLFGYIELARSTAPMTPESTDYLHRALGVFGQAKDLTRQLLTFSKGARPLKTTMALDNLLKDSAQFVLSGSNVRVSFQLPEDLWPCDIDENQIAQVVGNIAINARQAMPNGGTLTIRAANMPAAATVPPLRRRNYVRISIKDQGVGIAKAHLSRIFDPFFTTKQEGSGLGLTTSYSIVQRHEGHLEVESEPGKGSTFHIYLPASSQAAEDDVATPAQSFDGHGRILVMDDETCNLDVFQNMLTSMGYSVICAEDGEQAIAMFEAARAAGTPFNAVILDLTVRGGVGGRETVARMLQTDPALKAISVSGYSNDPVMTDPTNYGFKASLFKPTRKKELGQTLKQMLA